MQHSEEIMDVLREAQFFILRKKFLIFTEEIVEVLYDHMSENARYAIAKRLVGLKGLALLLHAPSIKGFLEVAGRESDPGRCAPDTIRARFGMHSEPARVGNEPWWDNAFHRPIDEREAARDLAYVFGGSCST